MLAREFICGVFLRFEILSCRVDFVPQDYECDPAFRMETPPSVLEENATGNSCQPVSEPKLQHHLPVSYQEDSVVTVGCGFSIE